MEDKQKRKRIRKRTEDSEDLNPTTIEDSFIGRRVSIFWPNRNEWFSGTVVRYNLDRRQHEIKYDDEPEEEEEILEHLTGRRKVKFVFI